MGSIQSKKEREEKARALHALLKASIEKRLSLQYQINNIKIRQNYSSLNPNQKTLKEFSTYKKTIMGSYQGMKALTKTLQVKDTKLQSFLDPEPLISVSRQLEIPAISSKDYLVDVKVGQNKAFFLKEKLKILTQVLKEKKKVFEQNKKKISSLSLINDLAEGKTKISQFLHNDKSLSRDDTCDSSRNKSANQVDFLEFDKEEIEKLNQSEILPARNTLGKLRDIKQLMGINRKAHCLYSKEKMRDELKLKVSRVENKILTEYSELKKKCVRNENILNAMEGDLELHLKTLQQEIAIRESELEVEQNKKEYVMSILGIDKSKVIGGSLELENRLLV